MNRFHDSRSGRLGLALALLVAAALAVLLAWPGALRAAPRSPGARAAGPKAQAPKVDYLELAAILLRDGHHDRAAALLSRVKPEQEGLDRKRYHKLAGLVAAKRGDHRGAIEHLRQAIRLGERNPRLHLQIAQSSYRIGEHRGALRSLDAAGSAADDVWGAALIRTQAHWKLGQKMAAFRALERGLRHHPRQLALRRHLVMMLIGLRLYLQALEEGSRFLATRQATLEDYLSVAEALRRARQPRKAALILEQARLRRPYHRQVLLQLARCYLDDEKPLAAATLLHRASFVDPKLRVEAAELYRRAGKLSLALLLNAQVSDQRAKLKQRLGLLIQQERFEEASALQPRLSRLGLLEDQQLVYGLAYSYFRTGKLRRAEAWLQRISAPDLFHKVVELRRVMAACREAGWQCRQ
jgi:tetratricopeptide (TPR) repeat protein